MKIAYLILAHGHYEHLTRIVNSLASYETTLFIHIDSRAEISYETLKSQFSDKAEVYFIDEPIQINWGGFSVVQGILKLLSTAIQKDHYDYFSLISGQDFPVKNNQSIHSFLEANSGAEFVNYYPLPDFSKLPDSNGGQDRYDYFWLMDELGFEPARVFVKVQHIEGIKRTFPDKWQPYGGSMWFTITQACAIYICEYLRSNPAIILFFKHTLISDELLIPSLLLNSPFSNAIINNNLRYITWTPGSPHPKILTMEDFPGIQESNCFFARKFDYAIDRQIVNKLEIYLK